MHSAQACLRWAEEEFGAARLNDRRNVVRLVSMAASVLRHAHVCVAAPKSQRTTRLVTPLEIPHASILSVWLL